MAEKWHNEDEITKYINEIEFTEFDNKMKKRLEYQLFDIETKMIDDGEETGSYFVH